MKNPAISVIVPVYNVENYLEECLASIFRQTFQDFELICVDDGSTDSSGALLDKISPSNANMKVFHTKNAGQSAARNFGLSHAQGRYIVFIDGDDSIVPNYLEIFYTEIEQSQSDIVVCRRKSVPAICTWEAASVTPEKIQRIEGDIFGKYLRKEFKLGVEAYGIIWRRELLPDNPFVPGLIYEDYCFFYTRYFKDLRKISVVNEDLYMITKSVNSIMRSSLNSQKLSSFFKILQEIKMHIENFAPAYHSKIYYRTHNNMLHRSLRELVKMPAGDVKNDLLLQFRIYFRQGLQDGSIQIKYLKFKYKILAICAIWSKDITFFYKAAKILL